MVSVNTLVRGLTLGKCVCVLHRALQEKAEGHAAFFPPPTCFFIWLTVHIRSEKGFIPAFFGFPEMRKYPRLHTDFVQSMLWSYIKITPLFLALYEWNKWMMVLCGCAQGRQVGEALFALAQLDFLGLQIRMQKNNALSALAKWGTFLHIFDMWSYQQTAFSFPYNKSL